VAAAAAAPVFDAEEEDPEEIVFDDGPSDGDEPVPPPAGDAFPEDGFIPLDAAVPVAVSDEEEEDPEELVFGSGSSEDEPPCLLLPLVLTSLPPRTRSTSFLSQMLQLSSPLRCPTLVLVLMRRTCTNLRGRIILMSTCLLLTSVISTT
jgi:hypothetical protein